MIGVRYLELQHALIFFAHGTCTVRETLRDGPSYSVYVVDNLSVFGLVERIGLQDRNRFDKLPNILHVVEGSLPDDGVHQIRIRTQVHQVVGIALVETV